MFRLIDETARIFPTFYAATRNQTHISSAAPLCGTIIPNALPTEQPKQGQSGLSCFVQTETTLLNRTVEFSFLAASKKTIKMFRIQMYRSLGDKRARKVLIGREKKWDDSNLIWIGFRRSSKHD